MTLTFIALLVVLGTSLGWSILDLLRKMLVGTIRPVALLFLMTIAQSAVFVVWVAVDSGAHLEAGYWLPALGSVALNVIANVAFIEALALAPLSLTIPLLSLTPALATLAAVPLVGELPSRVQTAGILMVVVGALYLSLEGDRTALANLWRALRLQRGTQLMCLVAVAWSLAIPLDKLAMRHASTSVHSLGLTFGVCLGSLAILLARRQLGDLAAVRRVPGLLAAGIAVSSLATALQLLALTMAGVSLVETVKRGFGNLASVVFGRAFFGEPVTRPKLVAVGLMVTGVVLIAL